MLHNYRQSLHTEVWHVVCQKDTVFGACLQLEKIFLQRVEYESTVDSDLNFVLLFFSFARMRNSFCVFLPPWVLGTFPVLKWDYVLPSKNSVGYVYRRQHFRLRFTSWSALCERTLKQTESCLVWAEFILVIKSCYRVLSCKRAHGCLWHHCWQFK